VRFFCISPVKVTIFERLVWLMGLFGVPREMLEVLRLLLRCRSGATAVEYGLVAVIIVIGLISIQQAIGASVTGFFMEVATGL
jgi:Flp pilus assembly pilin Flp